MPIYQIINIFITRGTSQFGVKLQYFSEKIQRKFTVSMYMPTSKSELTPIIFKMELTHLGLETSIYSQFESSHNNPKYF